MSYHIISIDSPRCSISCRDGQLVCKTETGERRLPLEDVASIIITSFSSTIHSQLFIEAAKHGIALILCESFKPISLVLPATRATDTLLTRAQINLSSASKDRLWQKTVDAKCQNQYSLAESIAPKDASLPAFKAAVGRGKPHKEAACARWYWQILARNLNAPGFVRNRFQEGLNSLLNYGYAVLLSTCLQKLFGAGLDPTFGISHVIRERAVPLAYDVMEPFRPCVDWRVIQWTRSHPEPSQWEVTKEFRHWVTGFPLEKVGYFGYVLEIRGVIEGVVRSLRRAILDARPSLYKPWTPENSKWAGW